MLARMSDVEFIHVEKELIMIDNQRVGALMTKNGGNVLTNIRIEEDKTGNGYGRSAMTTWADKCKNNGFENAYVVNVNHKATAHILDTFDGYETEKVDPRDVPINVKSGVHISDICYRIIL